MTCQRSALALAVTAVTAVVAVVASPVRSALKVDLHSAVNRTVCPFVVDVDEDPTRVPRVIKHIRCAAEHHQRRCRERHLPGPECCERAARDRLLGCVELSDAVPVQIAGEDPRMYPVAVGCVCMKDEATPVLPHPGPAGR